MGTKILLFLAGTAVGVVVCALVLNQKSSQDTAAAVAALNAAHTNQIAELHASLSDTEARLNNLRQENDRLANQVQTLLKKQQDAPMAVAPAPEKPRRSGLAALFGGDGTNGMSEAMTGMMRSVVEQQVEGKISGMRDKLKLTSEQEKAVREALTKLSNKGIEMAQKMFSGESSKEQLVESAKETGSESDIIKSLLTPEQLASYEEYEKDERARMARLMANSELMQMQTALQLTEEQQDKVFAVLADEALTQTDPAKMASAGFDFRKMSEKKAEALRGILTAEQFDRYQKFQEQQLKLVESFMPAFATNRPSR